jgi:perosamine synthetase
MMLSKFDRLLIAQDDRRSLLGGMWTRREMIGRELPNEFNFYRGRTALYALLRALDVRPGDEIIVQAYTCLAVVLPILGLGAIPIYAEIDPTSFSFAPASVESLITPRSRVLIVQHTFGIPANLAKLLEIARAHGLHVLEDCCHVSRSTYKGAPLGSFGEAAFYSYQWSKPLVLGRGGSALINEPRLADRMASLYTEFEPPGFRDRLGINLQYLAFSLLRRRKVLNRLRHAIRLIAPMATGTIRREELEGKITGDYHKRMSLDLQRRLHSKRLQADESIARRHFLGVRLDAHLQRLGVSTLRLGSEIDATFMRYPALTNDRSKLLAEGRAQGVELDPYFATPIDPLPSSEWERVCYRAGSCPVAEDMAKKVVTIPLQPWTSDREWNRLLRFLEEMKTQDLLLSNPYSA